VANPYFSLGDVSGDTARYESDASTGGPWSPELQHGGPPNALLVHAAEQAAAAHTGRSDLVALRTAAEFVGPVPVAQVEVLTSVVRAARSAVLVEASLRAHGRECLRARIWLVRSASIPDIAAPPVPAAAAPPDGLRRMPGSFPYAATIEWRSVFGGIDELGPSRMWTRPTVPVVDGHEATSLQRAALVGDSASGISGELDWGVWSFLNVDLDVHLARPMVGEWIEMDARTILSPTGSGMARSELSDLAGPLGATGQTLVVERRRR
jgi:acyl-Coa thioesterase superfamily protein/acyl-CoA thioesterase superfamily protein